MSISAVPTLQIQLLGVPLHLERSSLNLGTQTWEGAQGSSGVSLSHLQSLLWGRGNQRQMRWRLWSWLPQAHMVIVATTHSISQGPGTYQSAVTGWSEVLTASRDIAGQ